MIKTKHISLTLVLQLLVIAYECRVFVNCARSLTEPEKSLDGYPSILVTIPMSNEEHMLPHFFAYFERLSYPKHQLALWIRSDHNQDNTPHMLDVWLEENGSKYMSVNVDIRAEPKFYRDSNSTVNWPLSRYETIINIKEQALTAARLKNFDYILFLDTDALLANENVLQELVAEKRIVIAPMLQSRSAYSNFWGSMDEKGYYERSDDYMDIVEGKLTGTWPVALVHSAVLVKIGKESAMLTFNPHYFSEQLDKQKTADGRQRFTGDNPYDDIITFARSAQLAGVEQAVTNRIFHGHIMYSTENANRENMELINLKLALVQKSSGIDEALPESSVLRPLIRPLTKDSLGVDEVYMINLERRRDRYERMRYCFDQMGVRFKHTLALDGKMFPPGGSPELERLLRSVLGYPAVGDDRVQQLENYRDPYHKRNMTLGEIGCLLSHYRVWMDVVERGLDEVIIFEDDIHFEEPYFRNKLAGILGEIRRLRTSSMEDLDLVYLGRKKLANSSEPLIEGTNELVRVDYSYWTLSYYLTRQGAQKLLDGGVLSKMVPVDEYLPIMFDRHPRNDWKEAFAPRNLNAASVEPLLVFPTHYTGEKDYVSDTEDSPLLFENANVTTTAVAAKNTRTEDSVGRATLDSDVPDSEEVQHGTDRLSDSSRSLPLEKEEL